MFLDITLVLLTNNTHLGEFLQRYMYLTLKTELCSKAS